jgi:hypothetical protein
MALHAVKPPDGDKDDKAQEPSAIIRVCPVCEGDMEVAYDRYHQKVCVCVDCHTAITVPGSAWEIARIKRETKWMPKP